MAAPAREFLQEAQASGWLTAAQCAKIAAWAEEEIASGREVRLGDVLIRKGLLAESQAAAIEARLAASGTPTLPAPGSAELAPLPSLDSKFELGELLGRGGMGEVRLAADRDLRREVAIKTLLGLDDEHRLARFIAEAQIMGQLEHPNIVPVHDLRIDAETGQPSLVMRRVRGENLTEVLAKIRGGRRSARQTRSARGGRRLETPERILVRLLDIFDKVCDAVAYAHSRGVIHRDLKPDNVMAGEFGDVLLMDWGLAKVVGAPERSPDGPVTTDRSALDESRGLVTIQGAVLGTPVYMPPEQARGELDKIDERSDIYSLGAILYEILTLKEPYSGDSTADILLKVTQGALVPPRRASVAPWKIPPELEAIALKAMSPDKRGRYPRVGDLQADLDAYRAGLPVSAYRGNPAHRAARWTRRHPTLALSSLVTALSALLLAGVVLAFAARSAREENERLEAESRAASDRAARIEEAERRKEAELLALAQKGKVEELVQRLGGKLELARETAYDEFRRRCQRGLEAGRSHEEMLGEFDPAEVDRYVDALQKILDAHAEFGEGVRVTAEHHFDLGLLYHLGKHDLERAIEYYGKALELDPEFLPARADRAVAYHHAGKLGEALADLDEVLRLDARSVAALNERALVRGKMGDRAGAIEDLTEAIRIDRGYWRAYYNRGLAMAGAGQLSEALADYTEAIRLQPGDADLFLSRGVARRSCGDLTGSIEDFTEAIRIDPRDARAHHNRGDACLEREDWEGAARDFAQAVRLDPTRSASRAGLEKARARLEGRREGPGSATSLYARATERAVRGELQGAIDDLTAAIGIDAGMASAYALRGELLCRLGDVDRAVADLDEGIRLDPSRSAPHRVRGQAMLRKASPEEAIRSFTEALRLDPADGESYGGRGNAHQMLGRWEEATRDYRDAVRHRPDLWQAWACLGYTLARSGDSGGAREAFDQALERCPGGERSRIEQARKECLGQ